MGHDRQCRETLQIVAIVEEVMEEGIKRILEAGLEYTGQTWVHVSRRSVLGKAVMLLAYVEVGHKTIETQCQVRDVDQQQNVAFPIYREDDLL